MAATTFIYDFDEINHDTRFTLADGTVLTVADASFAQLQTALRQLDDRRTDYLQAWDCGCDGPSDDDPCRFHDGYYRDAVRDPMVYTPLYQALTAAKHATDEWTRMQRARQKRQDWIQRLHQDKQWVTDRGQVVDLTQDLSDLPVHARPDRVRHLKNIMGWLDRREAGFARMVMAGMIGAPDDAWHAAESEVGYDGWIRDTPLYRRLAEIVAQASSLTHTAGDLVQAGRTAHHRMTGRWPGQPRTD